MPPASPPAFRRIPLHIGLSAAELETVGLHGSKSEGGWSFFREGDALYVARSFARTDCWMLRLHLDATGVVAVDVEGCVGKHATAVAALAWHVVHRHLLSGSVEYESDDALIEALEARVGRHALEAVPRSRATWIAYYEEETRRHPNCSGPWIEYAGLLSLGKDPSAARRAFGRAIELENSPTYLLKRAEFHLNCRDYDAMMPDLMATVDRFP